MKAEKYRPISLTSVVCKMIERIIRDKIVEHMESHNLFSVHQYGFRKGYSCVTQLIEVLDEWTEIIDQSDSVDVVFLDFKKAFDTVPHKRLIKKLKGYKIEGKVIKWIGMFLKNRIAKSSYQRKNLRMVTSRKWYSTRKCIRTRPIFNLHK